MIITFLMTDNVEPRYGMVTRMMTKHCTQLLCDDFISLTFSLLLLKITLLIIRVWVTNGAQTANGIFQTSNNSTYKSLPKTSARRIIPVKLYRVFLSRADASR